MKNLRNITLAVLVQLMTCAPVWLQANSVHASDSPAASGSTLRNPFSSAAHRDAPISSSATGASNPFRSGGKPAVANRQLEPITLDSLRAGEVPAQRVGQTNVRVERTPPAQNPFSAQRTTPDVLPQAPIKPQSHAVASREPKYTEAAVAQATETATAETPRLTRFFANLIPPREAAPSKLESAKNQGIEQPGQQQLNSASTVPHSSVTRAGSASRNQPANVATTPATGKVAQDSRLKRASSEIASPDHQATEQFTPRPFLPQERLIQPTTGLTDSSPGPSDTFDQFSQEREPAVHPRRSMRVGPREDAMVTPASYPPSAPVAAPSTHPATMSSPLDRPQIIFQPAVPTVDGRGRALLRPNVVVSDGDRLPESYPSSSLPSLATAPVKRMALAPARVTPASAPMPRQERQLQQPVEPKKTQSTRAPRSSQRNRATQSVYRTAQQPMHQHGMPQAEPMAMQPMPAEEMPIGENWMPNEEGMPVDSSMQEGWGTPEGMPYEGDGAACAESIDDSWLPSVGGSAMLGGPVGRACNGVLDCLHGPPCYQGALGVERVMFAPFFIETTQPLQNCRVRFDSAWDQEFPDRAEYFWPKTPPIVQPNYGGADPPDPSLDEGEPSVDYQDVRFLIERGTQRFSVATEIPIRAVDPVLRHNSAGLGDMNVLTKTVLLDGRRWQLSQLFRTYFPTGSSRRGIGNGHFSLEPGVATRYKFSDITYFHGDLKYWFPLGGDPDYAGQFLNYGIGISHVAIDRDCFAVIPTLELVAWTVLDGQETPPGEIDPESQGIPVNNMGILNVCPGVRFVWENGNDCGTRELGISGGVAVTDDHWYESILRVDLRWSF